ncbi:hypothetical protein [Salinisphaera orenii]|uniref:hypothetical protein n=1 Tax=Salinisphaera orenii TaxID=856731 RepID=UPI000DBE12FD
MENTDSKTSSPPANGRPHALRWLEPRSVIVGGAAVAALGLVFNWNWIVAVGLAPLLFVLPCMLMMGWMMWSMRPKQDANESAARQETIAQTSDDPAKASSSANSTKLNEE